MTSVAAQPLSLVYVSGGPAKTPTAFGQHLATDADFRNAIADLAVVDRAVLRGLAQAIVKATEES